jgi:spermidine synthase
VLAGRGRREEAVAHYQQALQAKPDFVVARRGLAETLSALGRWEEAASQYELLLRLKPDDAAAQLRQAVALASLGRTRESIARYRQVLQRSPGSLVALNNLAWLLATHDEADGGDAAQALDLAQRARALSPQESAQCLDTLAAACAAASRFSDAELIAGRAEELAESAGQAALAENIHSRRELYRAGQPYRQPPPPAEQPAP